MKARLLILLLLVSCVAAAADTATPEWPQWRGPDRNGISSEQKLLKFWPAAGPALLWTYPDCGRGYSTVAIKDGLIVTAGADKTSTHVIALDLHGKLKWKAVNGSEAWQVPKDKTQWAGGFGGSRSTPTIDDGLVFHFSELGRLAAFQVQDGKEVWAIDVRKEFGGAPNEWGYSESPLIDGAKLYCFAGGAKGVFVALEKKTGKKLWAAEIGDPVSNSSPILVNICGTRQIITMSKSFVLGIDAESGKLLWKHPHLNRFKENCETPLWHADMLIVSSGYRYGMEALKIVQNGEQFTATRIWHNPKADNLHGGPIITDGLLFAASYDFRGFYCLDPRTGVEKYREPSIHRASFTFADGMLYCLAEDGKVLLVKPNPERYELVTQFALPQAIRPVMAHPVVCGGRLYVRRAASLSAYNVRAEEK